MWNDVKDGKSKRRKKPSFREGYYVSEKNGNKPMHYRSGYELEVYQALEKINEVVSYDVEAIQIPYWYKGESKTYFPDLVVQLIDGTTKVIEVKPSSQTTLEVNDAKWTSCNNFCITRGWEFVVLTEKGIEMLKKGKLL